MESRVSVMTDLDPFEREGERLGILRERSRRASINRSGVLIQDDDQREPGARAR